MTDPLIEIAEEMERFAALWYSTPSTNTKEWAARIRAFWAPERQAFYEAAMNHAKIATDEQIMLDDIAAWYERSHDEMTLAYRALMESERGESEGR